MEPYRNGIRFVIIIITRIAICARTYRAHIFFIDKEKTFGELKFTAVRDVYLQNEDGTPSTQLKKRIYDLKCSLHGGIIPVSVPPEVPLREFPYNAVVELVTPVADMVSRKTYTGADVDWYVKAEV